MSAAAATAALLLLADSRFPTGAHAHSAGVEASWGRGDICCVADVSTFIEGRLATSAPTEAAFAAAAAAAVSASADQVAGREAWITLDGELAARTLSPRLRSISRSLGRQLIRPAQRAWPALDAVGLRAVHPDGPLQPIALGGVAAAAGLSPADAALCHLHQLVGSITTAAVRLLGLDPFDVHALAARYGSQLEEIASNAARWAGRTPDQLPSGSSLLADVLAEDHATWEVRLFGS